MEPVFSKGVPLLLSSAFSAGALFSAVSEGAYSSHAQLNCYHRYYCNRGYVFSGLYTISAVPRYISFDAILKVAFYYLSGNIIFKSFCLHRLEDFYFKQLSVLRLLRLHKCLNKPLCGVAIFIFVGRCLQQPLLCTPRPHLSSSGSTQS